uniref:coiled-coil domain-containing protein 3 isoform X2 n=1 Tax=Myxine glutinosa TaxID=7769 RepID=UPI0035900E6F
MDQARECSGHAFVCLSRQEREAALWIAMLGICFQSQLFFFALLLLLAEIRGPAGCSLPRAWRPQSDECRAELAESIVFAHVRAVRAPEPGEHRARGRHVPIPGLLYTAELELICDQAWGSMLTLPMGTRFNLTGLGYFSCYSYTVMPNNSYFIFLRLNYLNHFVPHGVNFQDGIFPDTEEMRRLFADRFQFANCTAETQLHTYTSRWQDRQEEERYGVQVNDDDERRDGFSFLNVNFADRQMQIRHGPTIDVSIRERTRLFANGYVFHGRPSRTCCPCLMCD